MNSRTLLAILLCLLIPAVGMAAERKLQALHIDSTPANKSVWLVEVFEKPEPSKNPLSRIYHRSEGEANWLLASSIPNEVTQVTPFGPDLALLLGNGQWMILGQSSGRPLPDTDRILALAGDSTGLFAIGKATAGASTSPATAPTTLPTKIPASAPATTAATTATSGGARLYQLTTAGWELRADSLPSGAGDRPVLKVIEGVPNLAVSSEGKLQIWSLKQGQWQMTSSIAAPGARPRELLASRGQLYVHMVLDAGGEYLLALGKSWSSPTPLADTSAIRDIGIAGGQLRLIFASESAIKERRIDPATLKLESSAGELILPEPVDVDLILQYTHWVMMGIITLVMIHTYRKREEYRKLKVDWSKLQLAPYGRRFFAGIIDFFPVIAALLYVRGTVPNVETIFDLNSMAAARAVGLGVLIFLAHTTLIETIAGRSLGKIVTNLHVLRVDGSKPTAFALFIRNVLRIVDVVLIFTLVLMVYLPLRQRLGDLAAGTIVTADRHEELAGPDA